jgi:TetR/AcrR family transcriptional regulator, transcriptional repressor for nem operon
LTPARKPIVRYASTHKQETREKLLESSRAIVKKEGFANTGVDALMSAVGLTGGAFYSHFASKSELFAALVERELEASDAMLAGSPDSPPDHVARCLRSYLSSAHALDPGSGCVLPALGAEIARAEAPVRAEVERSLKKLHKSWSGRLGDDGDAAWAVMAQCIGALLMARIVESDRTRQQILASTRRSIEKTHLS